MITVVVCFALKTSTFLLPYILAYKPGIKIRDERFSQQITDSLFQLRLVTAVNSAVASFLHCVATVSSYGRWLICNCMLGNAAAAICVWSLRTPLLQHSPMHPCRSSGLLIVHATCGNTQWASLRFSRDAECWFCLAVWHDPRISRPQQLECQNWVKNFSAYTHYASIYGISFYLFTCAYPST